MIALSNSEYQERISVATAAVADMPDPQLKQVAFAKILEQLLSQSTSGAAPASAGQMHSTFRRAQPRPRSAVNAGPVGWIDALVDEGFFQRGKTLRDVQTELQNRGHRIPRTSLSGPLQSLCRRRRLRRSKEGSPTGKKIYVYSTW